MTRIRERFKASGLSDVMFVPALVLLALAFAWLLAMCVFIALPVFPFAYYKDLGFNWEVVDWAVHTVHSPIDVFDSVAWSPWNGGPTLYLNSYLGDVPSIVVAAFTGDSWLAVKIVEVGQIIVAAAGGALMYLTFRRSQAWAACCGLLYAAAPPTVLLVRWNQDFGWIAALMPWALAGGRALIDRFGYKALPLVGLGCSFAGHVIAAQFLFFVSLPLYAAICTTPVKRDRLGMAIFLPLGLLTCLLAGAFVMLPSIAGHPLFSDAANRAASLSSGEFVGTFSETSLGLATLVLHEWSAIAAPEFNVGAALPWLCIPAMVVWIVALTTLLWARGLGGSRRLVFVIAPCVVLAMGVNVPGGGYFWHLLASVPLVNSIRTTDRFLAIVPLVVLLWFVQGLDVHSRRFRAFARVAMWLAVLVFAAFLTFDYSERSFTVDNSKGEREPQLDAVRQAVLAAGGRSTALVGVRGGSALDAAAYGRPAPMLAYTDTDLAGRYLIDGAGGAGIFGRAGIHTVVVGPSWTYDEPYSPSSANVFRQVPSARDLFSSPEDVSVLELNAKGPVSASTATCVRGGPGAFDRLLLVPALADVSLVTDPESRCSSSAFVDFDLRDEWRELGPEDHWSASSLGLTGTPLRDADYHAVLNRTMLNIPWYRNSLDGERPVFDDSGAVLVPERASVRLGAHGTWPAGSTVEIRACTLTQGSIAVKVGQGPDIGTGVVPPSNGFRWYAFPVAAEVPSNVPVTITILPSKAPGETSAGQGLVIDGVVVLPPRFAARYRAPSALFLAHSLDIGAADLATGLASTPIVFAPRGTEKPVSTVGLKFASVGDTPDFVATSNDSSLVFRWAGAPGLYDVAASAQSYQDGASLALGTDKNHCCTFSVSRASNSSGRLVVSGALHLRSGGTVVVRLSRPVFKPELGEDIVDVRLRPHAVLRAARRSEATSALDLTDPLDLASTSKRGAFHVEADGLHASAGSALEVPIEVSADAAGVSAVITSSANATGTAIGELNCSRKTTRAPISNGGAALSLTDADGPKHCIVDVFWNAGDIAVHSIRAIAIGDRPESSRTRMSLWIAAGSYDVSLVRPDGTSQSPRDVSILGRTNGVNAFTFVRDGYYLVEFPRADEDSLLLLVRHGFAPRVVSSLDYHQTSALRWSVNLKQRVDVLATQLNDGNWELHGAGGNFVGVACDIVNTCFLDVPPGRYEIVHHWPPTLLAGVGLTLAAAMLSLGLLVFRPRRRAATPERDKRHYE